MDSNSGLTGEVRLKALINPGKGTKEEGKGSSQGTGEKVSDLQTGLKKGQAKNEVGKQSRIIH